RYCLFPALPRLHRGNCECATHPRSVCTPAGPDQAPRNRFQQEAFVSPMSLLADFATLSDRIPLVRYAFRAALAENQGLACLPLSHPEASLPWKSPDTRYHVFEAQVLPMLNSTFRMESHLRVFGLTNQLNIVFKRPRGWRESRESVASWPRPNRWMTKRPLPASPQRKKRAPRVRARLA